MSLTVLVLLAMASIVVALAVARFLFALQVADDVRGRGRDEATPGWGLSDRGRRDEGGWGGLLVSSDDDWLPTSGGGGESSRCSDPGGEAEWRF